MPPFVREGLALRETPLLHLVPDDDGDYAA
jgi:hypothetical protein